MKSGQCDVCPNRAQEANMITILVILGAAAITAGVALLSMPAAFIVGGLLLLGAAALISKGGDGDT